MTDRTKDAAAKVEAAERLAVGLPAKAKLLADLSLVSQADRARAGITEEMAKALTSSAAPKTGIEVVRGPWQAHAEQDVEVQVRVIDHDRNVVLWSGTEDEYAAFQAAMGGK